jgi:undecaprenyl diphosphate synthase
MTLITPESIAATRRQCGLSDERIPRSVAIIMDGNGRWARRKNLPRPAGHLVGAKTVRRIITEAANLGIEALILYSFSSENWSRPPEEVDALMRLYAEYLIKERPTVIANNIRLRHIGRRDGLPDFVLRELDETARISANHTGMTLGLAINYGSRTEILDAVRTLAARAVAGTLRPEDVDESAFSDALYTAGLPDPDLLIRTAGEMRISNYLLWQISYAELYVSEALWPDFSPAEFHKALHAYANRHRRFGKVDESNI